MPQDFAQHLLHSFAVAAMALPNIVIAGEPPFLPDPLAWPAPDNRGFIRFVVDIDRDGVNDPTFLWQRNSREGVRSLESLDGGFFRMATLVDQSNPGSTITYPDFDGDGNQEYGYFASDRSFFRTYEFNGFDTALLTVDLALLPGSQTAVYTDADGDGDLDILIGYSFPTGPTMVPIENTSPGPLGLSSDIYPFTGGLPGSVLRGELLGSLVGSSFLDNTTFAIDTYVRTGPFDWASPTRTEIDVPPFSFLDGYWTARYLNSIVDDELDDLIVVIDDWTQDPDTNEWSTTHTVEVFEGRIDGSFERLPTPIVLTSPGRANATLAPFFGDISGDDLPDFQVIALPNTFTDVDPAAVRKCWLFTSEPTGFTAQALPEGFAPIVGLVPSSLGDTSQLLTLKESNDDPVYSDLFVIPDIAASTPVLITSGIRTDQFDFGGQMAVRDVDNDGDADIVVPSQDHFRIARNDSTGPDLAFTTRSIDTNNRFVDNARSLQFDVDGESLSLLVVMGELDGGGFVSIGTVGEDGLWTELWSRPFPRRIEDVRLADLDSDGTDELLVMPGTGELDVFIFEGDPFDGFDETGVVQAEIPGSGRPEALLATDFDGDGQIDLGVVTFSGATDADAGMILWNEGLGGFSDPLPLPSDGLRFASSIDFVDFDQDGASEVVIVGASTNQVSPNAQLNRYTVSRADGVTSVTTSPIPDIVGVIDVFADDFNSDGLPDLIVVSDSQIVPFLGASGPLVGQPPIALTDESVSAKSFSGQSNSFIVCYQTTACDEFAWDGQEFILKSQFSTGVFPHHVSVLSQPAGPGFIAVSQSNGLSYLPPRGSVCSADLAEPLGQLNFFDLVAYLSLFNTGNAAADVAAPFGDLNFFDIAEYLDLFSQGCP